MIQKTLFIGQQFSTIGQQFFQIRCKGNYKKGESQDLRQKYAENDKKYCVFA